MVKRSRSLNASIFIIALCFFMAISFFLISGIWAFWFSLNEEIRIFLAISIGTFFTVSYTVFCVWFGAIVYSKIHISVNQELMESKKFEQEAMGIFSNFFSVLVQQRKNDNLILKEQIGSKNQIVEGQSFFRIPENLSLEE